MAEDNTVKEELLKYLASTNKIKSDLAIPTAERIYQDLVNDHLLNVNILDGVIERLILTYGSDVIDEAIGRAERKIKDDEMRGEAEDLADTLMAWIDKYNEAEDLTLADVDHLNLAYTALRKMSPKGDDE